MNLVLISRFLVPFVCPPPPCLFFFKLFFFVFQWFSKFFFFLNGISIVVDLKASFFCKVWIKDVSHVSFLKRYWIVLLMYKSWILWWCYVCYIVFTFTHYFFFSLPPYTLLPSQTKSFVEIMMRCCLDGSTREVECCLVEWRIACLLGREKYLHRWYQLKLSAQGYWTFFCLFFFFSFILDVAWH